MIPDNRYYIVRYTQPKSAQVHKPRHQYRNSTDLNVMLDDLKPNTEYEFTVKIVRGRRQSPWSLVVVNKTRESAPSSPPRDLTIHPAASPTLNEHSASITLNWRPPKTPNGKVNGYVIQVFYPLNWNKKMYQPIFSACLGLTATVFCARTAILFTSFLWGESGFELTTFNSKQNSSSNLWNLISNWPFYCLYFFKCSFKNGCFKLIKSTLLVNSWLRIPLSNEFIKHRSRHFFKLYLYITLRYNPADYYRVNNNKLSNLPFSTRPTRRPRRETGSWKPLSATWWPRRFTICCRTRNTSSRWAPGTTRVTGHPDLSLLTSPPKVKF